MKPFAVFCSLALLFILAGCATTDTVVLDPSKRLPTTSIEVYKNGNMPDRQFKEIAELSFLGPRQDELRAQKRFTRQAQEMGGNGIIFVVVPAGQKGGLTAFQTTAFVFKGTVIAFD